MKYKNGDIAPDFTLKNSEGIDIALSDFRDKKEVVLLFFPLAFTRVCTEELCQARDNMKLYNSLDAEILGISVDSFFTLKEFKKAQNLNFSLLSDFNKRVSELYDCLYDDFYGMKGVAKRSAFVIGKDGRFRYSEILEDAGKLPDFKKIVDVLSG
ncbi:MAG: redoxin domain-containing protein [Balneolaceae bacterium]